MSLNSSSTDAQVWAAFDDNASFEEDGSTLKAQAFVTACRILLRRTPRRFLVDGVSAEFNSDLIQAELDRARRFLAAKRSGGRNKYFDLRDCRD